LAILLRKEGKAKERAGFANRMRMYHSIYKKEDYRTGDKRMKRM
jgi:hypothetical protein